MTKNNTDNKSDMDSKCHLFKVSGQLKALLFFIVMFYLTSLLGLDVFFGKKATTLTGNINYYLAIIVVIVFYIMSAMLMTYCSDIIIDSIGISRCYLGFTWRTLKWNNIKKIRRFFTSNGFGKIQRTYNVFPTKKPLIRFLPSGKMTFPEEVKDAHKLTELLNYYILQYNIAVEVRETPYGEFISVKTLSE